MYRKKRQRCKANVFASATFAAAKIGQQQSAVALDWHKLWPFVVGAAIGVPLGVTLLTWANPHSVRVGVGIFLVLYSLYAFFRSTLKPVTGGGAAADAGVGFLNGVLAGITGLAGILVTIWSGLRVLGPAGCRLHFSDERALAWRQGNRHSGND